MASLAMAAAAGLTERGLRELMPGGASRCRPCASAPRSPWGWACSTVASMLLGVREFELSRDLVLKRLGRLRS